ncbi:MAG: hypothetical protein PHG89_09570 [Gallionella sp.]|nr:hypothetical protein [Gallionella sp.]
MSTTTVYFTQSELSLAAYGTFTVGTILTTDLTDPTVGMSDFQAARFIDQGWTVAAQYTDPATGVSATVFQDAAGKKYLAIRGTEPAASDLLADGLLALGIPSSLNPQFNALKTQIDLWMNDPNMLQGQTFTVSGHSLGGYLAAAVKEQYSAQVTDAYLFNAPGVGGPLGNLADALTSAFGLNGTPSGNIWNIRSSEGFPIISGLGYQLGTSISIQAEAASNAVANHFIAPLTDALAVQSIYAQLSPNLTQDQINAVVDASGATTNQTLESALDALRTILLGSGTTQTVTGDRNDFYTNLYNLMNDARYTALAGTAQLTVLAGLTASDMTAMAVNNNIQGLATRYALQALNPFVLEGADYSAFNTNGALELYDPNTGTGVLTEQYLADRTAMLERKIWFSTQDNNPVDPNVVFDSNNHAFQNESTYFEDVASGYKIAQGVSFPNTHHYFFGGKGDDVHAGAAVEDHLYGGAGNDTLDGGGGNDYLQGDSGNDILLGGAGYDTYFYKTGDGHDTILDSDGQGQIQMDGTTLAGGNQFGDARVFKSSDGNHSYVFVSGDAINGGDVLVDNAIIIKNVSGHALGTAGDLNLTFNAAVADINPATTHDIKGDPLIHSATVSAIPNDWAVTSSVSNGDGTVTVDYYLKDADGYPTEGGQQERADTLHDTTASDHIISGGGNDIIYSSGGSDLIEAGAGRDIVHAESSTGNNVIAGGADGDILIGGTGNDRLYADVQITAEQAIANGNIINSGSGLQGDWLAGGSGNDTLVGSTGNDVLSGGGGSDLLIGGAGNDDILGDANYIAQSLNWTVTDSNGTRLFQPSTGETIAADGAADVIYAGSGDDHAWGGLGNDVIFGEGGNDRLDGGDGNDIILGGTGTDTLWGGAGSDYLDGGAGVDELQGGAGADILVGGTGDDTIFTEGNDTIVYNLGDGEDRITRLDSGSTLTYRFGAGIDPSTFKLREGSLMLDFGNGDKLHIMDFNQQDVFNSLGESRFEFADGTVLNGNQLLARGFDLDGTAGDDQIIGTNTTDRIHGLDGNDTLIGLGGNDSLYGGAGDDQLHGDADTVSVPLAEQGNDRMRWRTRAAIINIIKAANDEAANAWRVAA